MEPNVLIPVLGALGGAIIGGAASFFAAFWVNKAQSKRDQQTRADALRQQSYTPARELFQVFVDVEREFARLQRHGTGAELLATPESVWTDPRELVVRTQSGLLSEEWARSALFQLEQLRADFTEFHELLDDRRLDVFIALAGHGRHLVSMHINGATAAPEDPVVFQEIEVLRAKASLEVFIEMKEQREAEAEELDRARAERQARGAGEVETVAQPSVLERARAALPWRK